MSFFLLLNVSALIGQPFQGIGGETIDGPEMKHSQVVGCGSYHMSDWKQGCCEGTGGCKDKCDDTPEYCD